MCHFLVYRFVRAFIKQFPLVLIIFRYAAMKWNAQQNDSQKYIWQTCTLQIFLSLSLAWCTLKDSNIRILSFPCLFLCLQSCE